MRGMNVFVDAFRPQFHRTWIFRLNPWKLNRTMCARRVVPLTRCALKDNFVSRAPLKHCLALQLTIDRIGNIDSRAHSKKSYLIYGSVPFSPRNHAH